MMKKCNKRLVLFKKKLSIYFLKQACSETQRNDKIVKNAIYKQKLKKKDKIKV